uniref:Uncharacterized protein n=1 Tax=Physcomitrium patens TaxID=3218 RepID=A0A2K1L9P8_PHYPA|nr:hypothetical protein PHYPA_001184 [Physcomitrium patens]
MYLEMKPLKSISWRRDSQDGVSSTTVIKAYTVSCLVLSLALIWSVGDAWCQYSQCCGAITMFTDGFSDSIRLSFNI